MVAARAHAAFLGADVSGDIHQIVAIDRDAPRTPLRWSPPASVLSVGLGGRVFRFVSAHPRIRLTLSNRFELFRVSEELEADCTVFWSAGVVDAPAEGAILQGTEIWETRRMPDGGEQTIFFAGKARRPYLSLTFFATFRTAEIVQTPDMVGDGVSPELHPLSEFLTSRVLTHSRRAEVHGSAVVADGRALLFVGHSGAGKTTISRIAEDCGALVLSDDRVIIGMNEGRATAWGTPWHGSGCFTSPSSSELAAVFLLRQGAVDHVVRISYAEAIKELFVRLIQVRVRGDEVLASHTVLEEILASVPAYEFYFRPTVAAFALARQTVDAQAH